MDIEEDKGYHYLRKQDGGGSNRLYAYGKERPTFYKPALQKGHDDAFLQDFDREIDLIIDDPPYGNTDISWDAEPDWNHLGQIYHDALKDDGQVVVFGQLPNLMNVYQGLEASGFQFRYELIWRKQRGLWQSKQQPLKAHENIYVFAKSGIPPSDLTFHMDQLRRDWLYYCDECGDTIESKSWSRQREGTSYMSKRIESNRDRGRYVAEGNEKREPISVLAYPNVHGSHEEYVAATVPQKPTKLLRWLIEGLSDPGDLIVDPHAGTASTLVAAIPLSRKAVGIEVNESIKTIGQERIDEAWNELSGLSNADADSGWAKEFCEVAPSQFTP